MPIRNEEAYIDTALKSIVHNGYPLDCLEILVIDGESDDGTIARVKRMQADYPQIRHFSNPQRIVPTAMNIGLGEVCGDIVFRLDGHAQYVKGYLMRVVEFMMAHPEYGCVGAALETVGSTSSGKAIGCAMSSPFGVGNSHSRTSEYEGEVENIIFGGYWRHVVQRVGPFDEELVRNQDDEYNYRVARNGYKLYMLGGIGALYYSRSTFRSVFRQLFQYGFWKIRVMQKLKEVPTFRSIVPFVFVLAIALGMCLALVGLWQPIAALVVLYLLFLTLGVVRETRDCGSRMRLFIAFGVLHVAYGWGEVVGILRFVLKLRIADQSRLSR